MKAKAKIGLFLAVCLATTSLLAMTCIDGRCAVTGDPSVHGAFFYGYRSSTQGPGDDAFTKCLNLSKTSGAPIAVVLATDSCSGCDSFAAYVNEDDKGMGTALGHSDSINAYFRINNSQTSAKACVDAWNFVRRVNNGKASCHQCYVCGEFADGVTFCKSFTPPTGNNAWKSYMTSVKALAAQYVKEAAKHTYTPPKASAGFACAKLELANGVSPLYVPLVRTDESCFAKAEKNGLKVVKDGKTLMTKNFQWATSGAAAERMEIPLTLDWAEKAQYQVILLNTNNLGVATNTITCVAAESNGFANPRFVGETNEYAFGEWTLDFNAATGGVWSANGYRGPVTNEARTVTRVVSHTFMASNKTDVVFETDQNSYENWTKDVAHKFTPSLVNRRNVTVYTNGVDAIEIKEETEEKATWPTVAAASYTNYTYSVVNKDYDPHATEVVTNVIGIAEQKPLFSYMITNAYTYVSTNEEHKLHGSEATVDSPAVVYDFVKSDKDTYYKGFKLTGAQTDTVPFSATDTNRSVYVTIDDLKPEVAVTNVCEAESEPFTVDTYRIEVTNFTYKVLVKDAAPTKTTYEKVTKASTLTANDTYHDITIKNLQHGYEPKGAAASEIQAATLVVSGASTTDAKLLAYAKQIFATTNFMNWATNNHVSLVLLDCTNAVAKSKVGQGLLTHNHAGDSCYISLKGLRAYTNTVAAAGDTVALSAEAMQTQIDDWNADYRQAAANEMEIILVRPNGTVAGRLAPQMKQDAKKNWVCDVAENIQRLTDLLVLVEDRTEELNDDPKTTKLEITYGEDYKVESMDEAQLRALLAEKLQTLMMSDKVDVFAITGVPANTPFTVGYKNWKLSSVEPTLEVCAWKDAAKSGYATLAAELADGVYIATSEQVQNGLFLRATAFQTESAKTETFGARTWCYYIPTVLDAPTEPGVIGFKGELNQTVRVAGEKVVELKVERTGYTGEATATVRLESSELPAGCLAWANEGGVTNLTWKALEKGVKSIPLTLSNVDWLQDVSNLVFSVKATGAELNVQAATNVIAVTQIIDPDAPTGTIAIQSPATDETIYVFGGPRGPLELKLVRANSWYENLGIYIARDGATGTVTAAGCTFNPSDTIGWDSYETGLKAVTVTFPVLDNNVSYKNIKLTVAGKDSDGKDIMVPGKSSVTVCVLPRDSCDFTEDIVINDAVQYVELAPKYALLQDFATEDLEFVSVSKISGEIPSGVSVKLFASDVNPGLVVSGTPTKSGSYEALYWMKLRRKSDRTTLMTKPCKVRITVKALAKDETTGEGLIPGFDQKNRAWTGLALIDPQTKRLAGLLDLTVRENGRTTAKWRKAGGKNVSFSASSLSGCTQDEQTGTNVYAKAAKTQSKVANAFDVTFWADGSIEGYVSNEVDYAEFVVPAAKVWSEEHTAEAWKGNYTLAFPHDDENDWNVGTLCSGAASLRVRFTTASQFKTGKAIFAGYLPNGRSVSGTAAFVPAATGAEVATLPIFYSTAADTFGAVVDVAKAEPSSAASTGEAAIFQSETATNFWQHVESGIPEASYDNDYAVVGTRYEAENWEASWKTDYGTNVLCFAINGQDAGGRIAAKGATLKVAEKGLLKSLSFAINNTSGEACGAFRDGGYDEPPFAEGKTATWRGVVFPGYTPFMAGAYWYSTTIPYTDAKGVERKRSVKVGGTVSLVSPLTE